MDDLLPFSDPGYIAEPHDYWTRLHRASGAASGLAHPALGSRLGTTPEHSIDEGITTWKRRIWAA